MWRNSRDGYGRVSIALHWLIAVAVFGLFGLGLWMVELEYYDAWYNRAPDLHRSAGVLLAGVMLLRLLWRYGNPGPRLTGSLLQQRLAGWMHRTLDILLFAIVISGYLISTADGRPIDVFGLFRLPATLSGLQGQEDIAGQIHKILAFILIGLAVLHALAAFKHHLLDRDRTLLRMLRSGPPENGGSQP